MKLLSHNIQLDAEHVQEYKKHYSHELEGLYNLLIHLHETTNPSPCTKFNCPMQKKCAETKMDCKAFRFWVVNNSYESLSKGELTCISKDMTRYMRPIESMTKEEYEKLLKEEKKDFYMQCRHLFGDSMPDIEELETYKQTKEVKNANQ